MFNSTAKKATSSLAIAVMLLSISVPFASASSSGVINACTGGGSLSGFSESDLRGALGDVSATDDEYYGCTAQINAALVDKATKDIPGHGHGVKSVKNKLAKASVNDLTTAAQRKKLRAKVDKETKVDTSKPLNASSDPAIATAAGKTLSSAAAPSTPIALVIGVVGLALLAGADLAGRVGKMPGVTKRLPGSKQRDDS
jgi:microcystin-dependent protein